METMSDDVKMVFVYGSLKCGYGNHSVMERSNGRFVGTHETEEEYTMIGIGSFPGVIPSGKTSIKGEVFEVDTLVPLDRLEGYPSFYDRQIIDTPYGEAWMYVLSDWERGLNGMYPIITDGFWRDPRHV